MKKYKYNIRNCTKCGTEFRPFKNTQYQCSVKCRIVITNCEYCNIEFSYNINSLKRFCSRGCGSRSNSVQRKLIQCKNCNKNIAILITNTWTKYCDRKCKDEYQKIMFKGENNPNFGNRKPVMFKHTEDAKRRIQKGILKSWQNQERMNKHWKIINEYKEKYGYYPMNNPEAQKRSIESYKVGVLNNKYKTYTHGKCGDYISLKTKIHEWYQSSWELIRMIELDEDENVKFWTKKHKICIKLGNQKYYIPDFLIEFNDGIKLLEEVKGYVRNKELFELKNNKAIEYIKNNNIDNYVVNFMNHLR